MKKGLIASLRVGLAAFVMLFATNLLPLAAAVYADPANNGTLKVHELGTPAGTESNAPKVCAFNFEGFGFDPGQTGYITIDGQGQTTTNYGPLNIFGPADANGDYATSYFNTAGGTAIADGHYTATLYGKNIGGEVNLNANKAKSKEIIVDCAPTPTPVTAGVTFIDLCGAANDTYTVPATDHVTYSIDPGTYPGSGTITVTATAAPGYVINGQVTFTHDFTNVPCNIPVTAGVVSFTDTCGITNDNYVVPTTPHVTYSATAGTHSGIGTVTITATADPGYVLTAPYTFTHDFTDVPCVTAPTPVPTVAPTSANLTCNNDGSYTIPTTVGVRYLVDNSIVAAGPHTVAAAGTVTVTAEALTGFTLTGPASWTFTFTTPTDCTTPGLGGGDTNGTVLGILTVAAVVTAPKAPAPQPELVNTGQNSIVDMIVGLAIAGIALTTAGLARRRQVA